MKKGDLFILLLALLSGIDAITRLLKVGFIWDSRGGLTPLVQLYVSGQLILLILKK